ncbi:MAG TPA: ribonuclease HII [Chloroflexi bacterium]|nr:ribonuclease HII [Chloroflexota bacterium]
MRLSKLERELLEQGYRFIAGLDEAGRGAWAGPVVAGAVILPFDAPFLEEALAEVNDSKKLKPAQREELFEVISTIALSIGVGFVPPQRIDQVGIVQATKEAMMLALSQLSPCPHFLLIDYLELPFISIPQKGIASGDALCLSIASASVVAKVCRDRWMAAMDKRYPGYSFASNKGYGTPFHRQALMRLGPSPIHRHSFAPVKRALERHP